LEESFQRHCEDEELREQIKKSGIGTSATRGEILDKLVVKFGLDKKEQAKLVLEKLSLNGLLDDEHFARIYADELIRKKHVSPAGLRAALSSKGVDRNIISLIIDEKEIDSIEAINSLLDTKYKNINLLDEKQCDKLITSLYRLGFLLNDIKFVLSERQRDLRIELLENM